MALTATTLAADADATTLRFAVTSSAGATVGGFMRVNKEFMRVVAIPASGFVDVRARGDRGGTAVAHDILSPVTFGLASEMAGLGVAQDVPPPGPDVDIVGVGENGVIAVPKKNTIFMLKKASALASTTFADPGADQDGLEVTFLNCTDAQHVITTVSVHDGTTGKHTTNTFAAYIGSSLTLVAAGGVWLVKANNNVTIS